MIVPLMMNLPTPAVADQTLAELRPHPRLLLRDADWAGYRARVAGDERLKPVRAYVLRQSEALLDAPPLHRELTGRRLLSVSRAALRRILLLASAYRLTEDRRFLDRAEVELLAVSAFSDFNPAHFLDVAEMGTALAIGYDWLYEDLAPATRGAVRQAIIEKVLNPAHGQAWWWTRGNNWNSVCLTGLAMAALAIADEEPALSARIVQQVRANFHHGTRTYAPDGVYPEGPGYWAYGTTYVVLAIEALETATGRHGLPGIDEAFFRTATFYALCHGPSGYVFNFGDNPPRPSLEPALFWLAGRLNQPELIEVQSEFFHRLASLPPRPQDGGRRFAPLLLIWTPPAATDDARPLPLHWMGRGQVPVAFHNAPSATDDPTHRLHLAIKAGAGTASHAHLDAGSFVFDLDGIRWAHDLGTESYTRVEANMEGFWNFRDDSPRWSLLRYRNQYHTTLTLGDQVQRAGGQTRIVRHGEQPTPHTVIDLSPAYAGQAERVTRGVAVTGPRSVAFVDEIEGLVPGMDVAWALITSANVELTQTGATLRQDGRELRLMVHEPLEGRALLEVDAVDDARREFESPNPGMRRVRVIVPPADQPKSVRLVISLSGDNNPPVVPQGSPLDWSAPLE